MGPDRRAFCYRKLIRYIGYFGDIGPKFGLSNNKNFSCTKPPVTTRAKNRP